MQQIRDLNKEEFELYHSFIYQVTGIHYPATKMNLLSNRIRRRLRHLKMDSYTGYLSLLKSRRDPQENQEFLNAITTNETYFFRCKRHWEFFTEWVEERKVQNAKSLSIWSAASSTGAEVYTIMIVLSEIFGRQLDRLNLDILATDLNDAVLRDARKALFTPYAVEQTDPDIVSRYFEETPDGEFQFDKKLASKVRFQTHNLMDSLSGRHQFDFVFLRNVMIYFDPPSKTRVLQKASEVIAPDGMLMIGESESLLGTDSPFSYVKPSIFQLPSGQPARSK